MPAEPGPVRVLTLTRGTVHAAEILHWARAILGRRTGDPLSNRTRRTSALSTGILLLGLTGCSLEDVKPPRPFVLRLYCTLRAYVARDDFRVPEGRIDPCTAEPPSLRDVLPPPDSEPDEG